MRKTYQRPLVFEDPIRNRFLIAPNYETFALFEKAFSRLKFHYLPIGSSKILGHRAASTEVYVAINVPFPQDPKKIDKYFKYVITPTGCEPRGVSLDPPALFKFVTLPYEGYALEHHAL